MTCGIRRPIEDRMRAAMAYIITGDSVKASQLCGIPAKTIRDWTAEVWWSDTITEARKRKNDELDACFTDLIHLATGEIRERLINGDPVKAKDGGFEYKPVSARDATWVAGVLSDKRAALRGDPTRITRTVNTHERLDELNKGLQKQATKKSEFTAPSDDEMDSTLSLH